MPEKLKFSFFPKSPEVKAPCKETPREGQGVGDSLPPPGMPILPGCRGAMGFLSLICCEFCLCFFPNGDMNRVETLDILAKIGLQPAVSNSRRES